MLLRILLVLTVFLTLGFLAQAQNTNLAKQEVQINDVSRIIFEHDDIYVLTSGGKEYRMHEWVTSLEKQMVPNKEICPRCSPSANFNFVQSKDGKMKVSAKGEMWGEIVVTITLASVH